MDLFAHGRQSQLERESPLANRMRPRTLDEFAGQEHIVGPGRLLRRSIQADQLSSSLPCTWMRYVAGWLKSSRASRSLILLTPWCPIP